MSTFSVDISQFWESSIGGSEKSGGSLTLFKQITGLTEVFEATVALANTSADNFNLRTIWQDGDADVADFDFLYIENLNTVAGEDLTVGFTRDRAGTPAHANLIVPAGNKLILPAGGLTTADLTDGTVETADLIDQIRFKNDNDATSADISISARLVLLT